MPQARGIIKEALLRKGHAIIMYQIMNGPVYCRCGTEIVVKILENQWFLDYGNKEWKLLAKRALSRMRIIPPEMRSAFERTIDWLEHRAMARTRGLGTPLPWDRNWVIESLSDSTIYMAFYTVSHLIKKYHVKPEMLTPEVWDYILLGKGNVDKISERVGLSKEFLTEARKEFTYWYPLDSRHSGKDLVENHLTFMIFHHAALFPEELWPRQIVTNGFVLYEGKKMSKSLRNIVPLTKAIEEYGPDAVRATLIYGAQLGQDLDFSPSLAKRLEKEFEYIMLLATKLKDVKPIDLPPKDRLNVWLLSVFRRLINDITSDMDSLRFRAAFHKLIFESREYFNWWSKRKGFNDIMEVIEKGDEESRRVLRLLIDIIDRMLQPFAPFVSEEVWEILGHEGFVSRASWPSPESLPENLSVELEEKYLNVLINDINEIKKVLGDVKEVNLIIAPSEEYTMLKKAIEALENKRVSEIYKEVIKRYGKGKGAKIARLLFKFITDLSPELRELIKKVNSFDEFNVIADNVDFIKKMTGIEMIRLNKYEEDVEVEGKIPLPFRPAILAKRGS